MTSLLLPPLLPEILGDVLRLVVVAESAVILGCCSYVVDRFRHQVPVPVHILLWALTMVTAFTALGLVSNLLTNAPPTSALYLITFGTTGGTILAVTAAVYMHRPVPARWTRWMT